MSGLAHHPAPAPISAEAMVADIHELLAILPTDGAPRAVHSYLARTLRLPTSPRRLTAAVKRDADRLQARLEDWDGGDHQRVLSDLARATEALAECVGAAADVAARHAENFGTPAHWENLADQTAGAYDAMVAAANLLRTHPTA